MNEAIDRAANEARLFSQRTEQFAHLTGPILRDLARNEAATREWRKAAVELMLDKGCPEVNHPDLFALLMEVKAQREAKDEVQSVVESAIEAPLDGDRSGQGVIDGYKASIDARAENRPLNLRTSEPTGPFKASFTTANL